MYVILSILAINRVVERCFLDRSAPVNRRNKVKKLANEEIIKAGDKFLDVNNADTFLKRPTAPPELSKKGGKLFNA